MTLSNDPIVDDNLIVDRKASEFYIVTWAEGSDYHGVSMEFKRFRKNQDGDPRPQVDIKLKGRSRPIHEDRINLTSSRTQNTVANSCFGKFPHIKWGSAIQDACTVVKNLYQSGEPVVDLSEMEEPEGAQYLIDPLLAMNNTNLFYGNGGLGKSWIALYLAALVASGEARNGFNPEPSEVLYLDYESDNRDMKKRFSAICRGLGVSEPHFMYRRMSQSIPDDQERLMEIIGERNVAFVIIDSAAPATGGKPEEAGITNAYFNALRSMEVTSLTIAHVSKEGAGDHKNSNPFGSIFWRNLPRNVWEVSQGNTFTKEIKEFGLYQTKLNIGAGDDPIGLRFTFDDPKDAKKVIAERINVMDNADLSKRAWLHERIEAYIKKQRKEITARPFVGVEISELDEEFPDEKVGISISGQNKFLRDKKKPEKFVQVKHGRWDLLYERGEDERITDQYEDMFSTRDKVNEN
tara:strand:+ start:219 stop:1607 length:1389 start_codon:yes stop_codon:yes gene_type:complete